MEKLTVIVHPHFDIPFKGIAVSTPAARAISMGKISLSKKAEAAIESEKGREYAAMMETMHKFYRKQVDRTLKQRSTHLLIVQTTNRFLDKQLLAYDGIPRHEADWLLNETTRQQERLVKYAGKLGKRLLLTHELPSDVGKLLAEKIPAEKRATLPVEVFGEYLAYCVNDAHESIASEGFKKARIICSKST